MEGSTHDEGAIMAAADTDSTSELPTVGASRRRRPPWLVAAGAAGVVALAVLGFVLLADDESGRLSSTGSQAPAPAVTTTVPTTVGSTATTAVAAATTTQPAPTVTTTSTPRERLTASSRLSLDGIGPVDIGMTPDQASAAAGVAIRIDPASPFGPACQYAFAADVPGLAFMVINGRIERVDVGGPGRVTTVSGIGTGDTEEAVKRTYGARIRVEGHPYVPTGHYLVYTPADPALAHLSMIFETDGQVVTRFRAGMKGAVSQIEGCA